MPQNSTGRLARIQWHRDKGAEQRHHHVSKENMVQVSISENQKQFQSQRVIVQYLVVK